MLNEAGIQVEGADNWWGRGELTLLAQGVVALAQKIAITKFGSYVAQTGIETGFARLKTLIGGGVTWYRGKENIGSGHLICLLGTACALEPSRIGFYDELFLEKKSYVRGTAVHELAHMIHFNTLCDPTVDVPCFLQDTGLPGWPDHFLTTYGAKFSWQYWAEAVTIWVYENKYQSGSSRGDLRLDQINYIKGVLGP